MTTPQPPQGEPQYQQIPQYQQQPPPYVYGQPPPAPPKKSKTWLWILLGVAALLVICCGAFAINTMSGNDDSGDTSGQGGGGADQPSPTATMPGIEDPVRDGKFEFTVRQVECGVDQLGPSGAGETAQGQFCLVTMKVKNIGNEPQTMSDNNQKGIGSNGAEYAADSTAGLYANDANSQVWITEINPGNEVTGVVVFDLPADVTLKQLELHDSLFSDGVKVSVE